MTDAPQTDVTLPVVSIARDPAGDVSVPASLVQTPVRPHLLYEAVKSQRATWRTGSASTKLRGEVRGGGKKPWRQKGTGRARAGSIRSPLWAGGGTTFGPRPRSYAYRLPRSARRAALQAAVSARHGEDRLTVIDKLELPAPKTKELVAALAQLGMNGSTLIVLDTRDELLVRAARNRPEIKVLAAEGLNVYDVMRHDNLVMTRAGVEKVVERLGGQS